MTTPVLKAVQDGYYPTNELEGTLCTTDTTVEDHLRSTADQPSTGDPQYMVDQALADPQITANTSRGGDTVQKVGGLYPRTWRLSYSNI